MDIWIFGSLYFHRLPTLLTDILASRFCQGKTEQGLNFQTFYGKDWINNTEKKFAEWAVWVFGGKSYLSQLFASLTHPIKDEGSSR